MKKTVTILFLCILLLALASCGAQPIEVDEADATVIAFDGTTASVDGPGASAQGADVTIRAGGTYAVRGETTDGRIVVDAQGADVAILLDNAQIACADPGAVLVNAAKRVLLCVKDGTSNTLSDGAEGTSSRTGKQPNACVFSKTDLFLAGSGVLNVVSSTGNGIKATNVTIDSGSCVFRCANDGVHADGDVTVRGGDVTITCGDDAIHAQKGVTIHGGSMQIAAHEGIEATLVTINGGRISVKAGDDGINAAHKTDGVTPAVEINGGEIDIETEQDGADCIDSNGDIFINGGTIRVTGQSAFDYDGKGKWNGGEVYVNGEKVTELSDLRSIS